MSVGQMGLVFLVISVSVAIAIPVYFWYLRYVFEPSVKLKGLSDPERLLVPALFGCLGPPVGLFIYGWLVEPRKTEDPLPTCADSNIEQDWTRVYSLDCANDWHLLLRYRSFHFTPKHLHLRATYLPAIRRFFVRRK